jgi:hypothetical protein
MVDPRGVIVSEPELNLHSYYGPVFDKPAEEIPVRLAKEILRVGGMDLAGHQRFINHVDFDSCSTLEVREEMELAEIWNRELSASRMGRFVIEIRPEQFMT